MPQSRNRPKHHHHHQHPTAPLRTAPPKTKRSAAFVVALLAAVFGLAVAYFTQGADLFWIVAGTAVGALLGYIVGRSMDKSLAKR